jgi:hypothetical protein
MHFFVGHVVEVQRPVQPRFIVEVQSFIVSKMFVDLKMAFESYHLSVMETIDLKGCFELPTSLSCFENRERRKGKGFAAVTDNSEFLPVTP